MMKAALYVSLLATISMGVLPRNSFAAISHVQKCRLAWNDRDGKTGENIFPFSHSFVFHPNSLTEVKFQNSSDQKKSTWAITQFFGDEQANSESFEVQCDLSLNCTGERTISVSGKEEKQEISFAPSIFPIGKIGDREIFRFVPKNDGFYYHYTDYELDGESIGMSLECHE